MTSCYDNTLALALAPTLTLSLTYLRSDLRSSVPPDPLVLYPAQTRPSLSPHPPAPGPGPGSLLRPDRRPRHDRRHHRRRHRLHLLQ